MSSQTPLILSRVLTAGASANTTDVHFSPGSRPLIRRAGNLEELTEEQVVTTEFIQDILSMLLTKEEQSTLQETKEISSVYAVEEIRYKIHAYYQEGQIALSLRPVTGRIVPVEQLGVPKYIIEWFGSSHGIILITGSYGSGRSTVAASALDYINRSAIKRILTIEDPIEFVHNNIKSVIEQRALGADTNSWAEAINSSMEEEIDVVFLSDINDKEVAKGMIKLASAGRLVVGVMTAADVVGALTEWTELFTQNDRQSNIREFARHLVGATAVRLIPQMGGGMVQAFESLTANRPAMNALIEQDWTGLRNTIATSRDQGMMSMNRALADLVKGQKITQQVAEAHALDIDDFRRHFR